MEFIERMGDGGRFRFRLRLVNSQPKFEESGDEVKPEDGGKGGGEV